MIWKKAITVGGKKMQFRDLQKQYNVLKEELTEKSKRYVQVHNIFLDSKVTELEEKISEYVGVSIALLAQTVQMLSHWH